MTSGGSTHGRLGRRLAIGFAILLGVGGIIVGKTATAPSPSASSPSSDSGSTPVRPGTPSGQTHVASNPPPDFRGLKWGSRPAKWMKKVGGPFGPEKLSVWKNPKKELPSFVNVPVAEEGYLFENDKLYGGEMFIDGLTNFETLKTALVNSLGSPSSSDDRIKIYKWRWHNPSFLLMLNYNPKFQRATVHIEKEGHLTKAEQKITETSTAPKLDETTLSVSACMYAQKVVTENLKAPSTADFPSCGWSLNKYEIRANKDRTEFSVIGYVDAQNSFGAKIRNRFVVILSKMAGSDEYSGWGTKKIAIAP